MANIKALLEQEGFNFIAPGVPFYICSKPYQYYIDGNGNYLPKPLFYDESLKLAYLCFVISENKIPKLCRLNEGKFLLICNLIRRDGIYRECLLNNILFVLNNDHLVYKITQNTNDFYIEIDNILCEKLNDLLLREYNIKDILE